MSEMFFENNGSTTYLVYQIGQDEELDSMSLGMLTNNRIPGLASAVFTQMDSQKFIKYNVTAKVSVKQFFSGQVNRKRLIGVFNGIVNGIISAEDYMIDTETIVLDLDYIFSDVSSCETVMICLPIVQKQNNIDLLSFFKTIMFSTQFDQTENCDYVAKIINFLNSASSLSVVDFKKILDSLSKNDTSQNIKEQSASGSSTRVVNPNTSSVQQVVKPQQTSVTPQPIKSQQVTTQNRQPVSANNPQNKKQPSKAIPQTSYSQQPEVEINDEDRISFMYLMQHYNKENAAKYKAQKAAKKAKKSGKSVSSAKSPKNSKKSSASFTVPGAPSSVGFAVPGQQSPQGFAIPNQQQSFAASSQVKNIPQSQPTITQGENDSNTSTVTQPQSAPVAHIPTNIPQGSAANFGETTVLGGGGIGETTVLGVASQDTQTNPHLIRTKNNEIISLNKPVFRIGKERSYVDYFVSDNTAVSRSHANIISRDGQYYIVDTNSTNHTYVNGGMIQSNVETPLSHATKIRLANEDFEFRLY